MKILDKELVAQVIDIVAQIAEVSCDKISLDVDLPGALGVNSMMGLEIMYAVEKKFKVHLNEIDLPKMRTVRGIYKLIDIATK